MAASGYTPISLYYSTTAAAVPTAGNLANGELGLNIADMKLYAKNGSGVVTLLASNASTTGVDSISFGSTGLTPSTATTGVVTVAGTLAIANGGSGQTTANTAFNAFAPSQTSNTGKYLTTDGTNTSWATVDALPSQTGNNGKYLTTNGTLASWASITAGAALSNDTSTASNLYPMFAAATTGTPTTVYTSNAKLLYQPSVGTFTAYQLNASNGLVLNATTLLASYTIPSGSNAITVGPFTVPSGLSVTVTSGQRWVVI